MVREASVQAPIGGGEGLPHTTTASLLLSTTKHVLPCTGPELCEVQALAAAQLTQQGQVRTLQYHLLLGKVWHGWRDGAQHYQQIIDELDAPNVVAGV